MHSPPERERASVPESPLLICSLPTVTFGALAVKLRSLVTLAFLSASALGAQRARVTHDAVIHRTWESTSDEVGRLATGDLVTYSTHRGGYTHVTPSHGSAGWIYSRYLEETPAGGANTSTTPSTTSTTTSGVNGVKGVAKLPKPPVVEANSTVCPNVGRSSTKLDSGTNLLKNRIEDGQYSAVDFKTVLALPWQGMRTRRYLWTPADLKRTEDYEGSAISVTGYLVDVEPKAAEAPNCGKTTDDWVDWHIWLVETLDEAQNKDKTQAIVVETTPRVRKEFPSRFDIATLRQWIHDGKQVTVSGWLMLDPDHPTDATGSAHKHPSRGTIWEIHPVMKIEPAKP
jgi:hypothetical protein